MNTTDSGYDLVQVLQERHDGWTLRRQAAFIEALSASGCIAAACRAVRLGSASAYRLRKRSPSFARAWDAALQRNLLDLERVAMEWAVDGVEVPVISRSTGETLATRRQRSPGVLMFMLRAANPEKYSRAMSGEAVGNRGPKRPSLPDARPGKAAAAAASKVAEAEATWRAAIRCKIRNACELRLTRTIEARLAALRRGAPSEEIRAIMEPFPPLHLVENMPTPQLIAEHTPEFPADAAWIAREVAAAWADATREHDEARARSATMSVTEMRQMLGQCNQRQRSEGELGSGAVSTQAAR